MIYSDFVSASSLMLGCPATIEALHQGACSNVHGRSVSGLRGGSHVPRPYTVAGVSEHDAHVCVRALLKYGEDSGQHIDMILAERVIYVPGQWALIEGTSPISWQDSLQSAAVAFQAFQLSRQTGTLPCR